MSQQAELDMARLYGSREAKVDRISKIGQATVWFLVGLLWLSHSITLAQTNQPPRAKPPDSTTLAPLPGQPPVRNGGTGIAPLPVSPPSILAPNVQPIDLTTALQLANVQNPEFNVARTRILEAAALRQLAAAYFLPSINPGMNYDSHTGNLQQSNGNILSVNRSAVYVGAGSSAIAAGTVNIPGVYYAANPGFGAFTYLSRGRPSASANSNRSRFAIRYSSRSRGPIASCSGPKAAARRRSRRARRHG